MSIEFFTQKAAKAALAAKDAKLADLKNQLATRKPLLTALAAFHDKNGRQPEGPELIELYDKVMPHSKSAASKPAPPTPAKTAAASTTPKVVATVPAQGHSETPMARKLRLAHEQSAASRPAKAQPATGKTLTKAEFDQLSPQAKHEFFRSGGKLC